MRLRIHHPELLSAPAAPPVRPPPSPAAIKLRNLKAAMKRWQASGFEMTPGRERKIRSAICSMCPHWNGLGNLGLGECRAPGCGCTRAKVWLATEECPLKKWKATTKNPPSGQA